MAIIISVALGRGVTKSNPSKRPQVVVGVEGRGQRGGLLLPYLVCLVDGLIALLVCGIGVQLFRSRCIFMKLISRNTCSIYAESILLNVCEATSLSSCSELCPSPDLTRLVTRQSSQCF